MKLKCEHVWDRYYTDVMHPEETWLDEFNYGKDPNIKAFILCRLCKTVQFYNQTTEEKWWCEAKEYQPEDI